MDLAELCRIYARQMLALANASTNVNLEDAYAAVSRQATNCETLRRPSLSFAS